MNAKADHVRRAQQTRAHECHWPGCTAQVKPAMWGCAPHWFRLPQAIRDAIWAAYRIGQEQSLNPSRAYMEAARRAQEWILENHPPNEPLAPSQVSRTIDNKTRDLFDDGSD